jgi:hypothetical protein
MDDRQKTLGIKNFGGQMLLTGYDTERDLKRAKKDVERMLTLVAGQSIYEIMHFLAPYRAKFAKFEQEEYDEITEKIISEMERGENG